MEQRAKLLALLQVPKLGAQRIGRLLSEWNFAQFCQLKRTELQQLGWNETQIRRWLNPDQRWIERALAWAEQPHQRLLTLFDDDYPFLLKQISTAPPVLFVRGQVSALHLPQIAMVGSREYTPYGEFWAGEFAKALVKNGLAVTSGLAIGIDGFCHQRVLQEGGITIAVLGSGLDRLYPLRHQRLAEEICQSGGALVSEFFPDQPPVAENFPRRNRIISGLSLGTLVVEATINSGSLVTARYALEQGREVFALPNSLPSASSAGCHKLIKQGALLVENVADILDAIQWQQQPKSTPTQSAFQFEPTPQPTIPKAATAPKLAKNCQNLTPCQQQIINQIALNPISVDDIAKQAELAVETVLVEMLNLELLGVVRQVTGGYVQA